MMSLLVITLFIIFCVILCFAICILKYYKTTRYAFNNNTSLIQSSKHTKLLLVNMLKNDFFTQSYYFFYIYDIVGRYEYYFTKENTLQSGKYIYTIRDDTITVSYCSVRTVNHNIHEYTLEYFLQINYIINAVCMIDDKIVNTYHKNAITDDHKIDIIEPNIKLVDINNYNQINLLNKSINKMENMLSKQIYSHTKIEPIELNYLILSYIV